MHDNERQDANSNCRIVKPPSPITGYLTRYVCVFLPLNTNPSFLITAALDPVTTTLADVQRQLSVLTEPSMVLLNQSLESDLYIPCNLRSHIASTPCCSSTTHVGLSSQALTWLTHNWLDCTIQDADLAGTIRRGCACVDLLKSKIEKGVTFIICSSARIVLTPGCTVPDIMSGSFRGRTVVVPVNSRAERCTHAHGDPGIWHGTSATAPVRPSPVGATQRFSTSSFER